MQSSDEHFSIIFSFFFYKKSNDIFFSTFIKFGWGDERWGKGDFPTGSRSLFRVDRYSIYIFSFPGPGHPHARVTVASALFPPLPRLLPTPTPQFFSFPR